MGLFDFFRHARYWIEDRIDDIKDFFTGRKYDSNKVSHQVDAAAAFAKFREDYSDKVDEAENQAMDEMNRMFDELLDIANKQKYFSDLGSVIKDYQERAKRELKGTIIAYITEHLSQTDPKFKKILEMSPSPEKKAEIESAFKNTIDQAFVEFGKARTEYTEKVLSEFKERFDSRISEQEEQADQKIKELEKIMANAEAGMVDVDKVEDECAPAMEASQCIITVLNKAVIS